MSGLLESGAAVPLPCHLAVVTPFWPVLVSWSWKVPPPEPRYSVVPARYVPLEAPGASAIGELLTILAIEDEVYVVESPLWFVTTSWYS